MAFSHSRLNEDPSQPSPQGGGLNPASMSRLTFRQAVSAWFLPSCGGDDRQARGGFVTAHVISAVLLVVSLLAPIPAFAVNPDEILADPVLEQRARNLSAQLRCMVCQNQSIDDSNAELARDLRLLVRERIVEGESDEQVIDYVVSRYGEFVLLNPRLSIRTYLLWGAPMVLLGAGALALVVFSRSRQAAGTGSKLSADEESKLKRLLGE